MNPNEAMTEASTTNPMDRYAVRDRVQTPTRVHLNDPVTNEKTGDYLDVRSSLSTEFMEARDEIMQEVGELQEPNAAVRKERVRDLQLRLTASLVAGWSFPEPATVENVKKFLFNAPQIRAQLNAIADDTQRFFNAPSNGSFGSLKQK